MSKNTRQYLGGSPQPSGADSPSAQVSAATVSGGGVINSSTNATAAGAVGGKKRQTPVNTISDSRQQASHTPTLGVMNNSLGATPRGAFSGSRPNSRTQVTKVAVPQCESPSGALAKSGGVGAGAHAANGGGGGLLGSNGPGNFSLNLASQQQQAQQQQQQAVGSMPAAHVDYSTTPDTMMDEFDFMLTEENLGMGVGGGGSGGVGGMPSHTNQQMQHPQVLTDFHSKLGATGGGSDPHNGMVGSQQPAKPTATKPGIDNQSDNGLAARAWGWIAGVGLGGASGGGPGVSRHGAVNPVGVESPSEPGYGSNPNTPALRPMSRAPAASVCNYCGTAGCSGCCPGARESSPLLMQALQSQRVVTGTGGSGVGQQAVGVPGGAASLSPVVQTRLISPNQLDGGRPKSTGEDRTTPHHTNNASNTPRNGAGGVSGASKRPSGSAYHVDPTSPAYSGPPKTKQQQQHQPQQLRLPQAQVFSDTRSNKSAGNNKLQRPLPSRMSDSSATASSIHSCKTQPATRYATDLEKSQAASVKPLAMIGTLASVRKNQRRILRSQTGSAFSDTRSNMSVPSPTKSNISLHHGLNGLSHPAIEAAQAAGKLH